MTYRHHPALSCTLIALCVTFMAASPLFAQTAEVAGSSVVEITATDYAFRAPDAIPSGWTTIRFINDGEETHFILMSRLPEGKTIDDYETDLAQPFSKISEALITGEIDRDGAFERLAEAMPEWFPQVQFMGGPGYIAPGRSTETTLYLEPGNYSLECYVKTEDGTIHYMEGMLRPMTVTEEDSGGSPPEADVRINLSNFEMDVQGELTPGRRTIAVHVEENPEQGFGHNAHLARLNDDVSTDELLGWMDWFSVEGVRSPAPAEFLGGVHLMPVGSTGYFTVDLEPGRYAFISEYTAHRGVMHEFKVAP